MNEEDIMSKTSLVFYVNGTKVTDISPDPEETLLTYLRNKYLTGSKLGCGEGGCGACTVMVSRYMPDTDTIQHYSVNACLALVCSMHGLAVTTVEGIGNMSNIHPVQERIAKYHGSQCGFCTPGIVMSMYTLLRNNSTPTAQEMEEYFDGNLCRCTGYRAILDGFRTFTKDRPCGVNGQCCQQGGSVNGDHGVNNNDNVYNKNLLGPDMEDLKPYNSSQEPIFPPDLKVNHKKYHHISLQFSGPNVTWFQPATMNELVELKTKYPNAKLVVGNTEIGVETKFKNMLYPVLISTVSVPELLSVTVTDTGVTVGASVTLSTLMEELKQVISSMPGYKVRVMSSIVEMLRWFASHQIRNVADISVRGSNQVWMYRILFQSVGGNLMTASPISDLNPLLLAAGAKVHVQSRERGTRTLEINKDFFCGYRKTALTNDELLISITIPYTNENEYFEGFKQANRKDDDISLVNASMKVVLSEAHVINKITLAFGGMGIAVVLANKTMEALTGEKWCDALVTKASDFLTYDLPVAPGSPGGAAEYRRALALSFFFKFYVSVRHQIHEDATTQDHSAIQPMETAISQSIQVVGATDSRFKAHDTVGKSVIHTSALQQSTGEAVYIDDMIPVEGELHMALVLSTRPYAKLVSIDPSSALAAPGVVDFMSAADVPGVNSLGIWMDTVFAKDEVTCQGQIIGAIIADSNDHAWNAAKLVKVQYKDKSPVIITIKDAIKHKSFYKTVRQIVVGNLEDGFSLSDFTLEGECRINGQNHFYLETMCTRVLPGEDGEIEVFASTQNPTQIQDEVSKVLGVPSNKVVVRTRRLGGGFGGKETQPVLMVAPAAVAARKLGRPVRCVLDRDVDMITTGNRHPFFASYKAGFTKDGHIQALDLELYSNAGNSMDLSTSAMERALLTVDSSYFIPNMVIVGRCCKTNIMSNTAFRGFGAAQGSFIIESIIDDIAAYLIRNPMEVREKNFYHHDSVTHFDMPAGGEQIQRCWDMCLSKCQYNLRRQEIVNYNRLNQWKKKGIAITPVKYGICFVQSFLNQAGALVHIYKDGSVLVAHSGTEMGQGLHIKVSQVASEVLEIPLSRVHVSETATNTVPNTVPTAASVSTDLNGMAVRNACETLKARLRPYVKANPDATWEELIKTAYMDRVSLSSTGYYCASDVGYNMETQTGKPFAYFTAGVACSEVQIDCLTGDHKLLRTDIVMDIGNSINPAIDVGQIEGAFTQGYGLHLLEDIKVTPDGSHLTRGPGTYKIPSFGNIPTKFNVYLVPDSPNPAAVFFSRGLGEPPLLLASSAFFAVKDAVRAARKDFGESLKFQLNSPALPANIRMACQDSFAKKFPEADPESYIPWAVDL